MKLKTAIMYLTIIVLLAALTIISGFYAKVDWMKGQIGQLYPAAPAVFTPYAVTKPTVESPEIIAETNLADNVSTDPVKVCVPDATATKAAIHCLRASPEKWDPTKESIQFIYILEGSTGASVIRADIYDINGQLFYSLPIRTSTKNNVPYIDIWQGLDQEGFMIAPGKYYYAVYGEENNAEHILSTIVYFEVI